MDYKIGNKLKYFRSQSKITQSDVASVLGISRNSYISKENGTKDFTQTEIEKLKVLFNRSYDELFFADVAHEMKPA
jgi:DNA-binding XRE family transcriptional regulator